MQWSRRPQSLIGHLACCCCAMPSRPACCCIPCQGSSKGPFSQYLQPRSSVKRVGDRCTGVLLNSYDVIYTLVDDVRAAMEGRLNSVEERTPIGEAEVHLNCCQFSARCVLCLPEPQSRGGTHPHWRAAEAFRPLLELLPSIWRPVAVCDSCLIAYLFLCSLWLSAA